MANKETVTYVIDENYKIVSFNETIKEYRPNIEKGMTCHEILKNRSSVCDQCPVFNQIKGLHICFDPVLDNYVSIDCATLDIDGFGTCHVVSFSVESGNELRKHVDTTETSALLDRMRTQLDIVNALSRGYLNVYLLDLSTRTFRVIKLDGYVVEGLVGANHDTDYVFETFVSDYAQQRVHPDDKEAFLHCMNPTTVREELERADEFSGHYRILVDGELHYFQYRFAPVTKEEDGSFNQVIVGFQNIDALIEEEAASRQMLADALVAAEHSNRAKTTFLNNMSHDIRTPMNAIIGFTSLAAAHIGNEKLVMEYLKKIQTSSHHLLSLINDVLDMSRIESGKMHIEEAEANLASIMHDLKTIVQSDVNAKHLDFFIDTVDIANEIVYCDKLRLSQLLLNLLSNAVKFTEPGGVVSVRIAQKETAPQGYADYEFRVKDSGIGMSPDFVTHVFEAFERERNSTVSGTQGAGLGMAITKNIVDMMGGTIEVHSVEGKGTEFVVMLRFRTSETRTKNEPIAELQGLRALVADDNLYTCTSVVKMLQQIGMRADWTTSGKEAVYRATFALDQGDEYYAYIIDWLMPDMNGIECVRRIRAVIGDSKPIIILTAYDWSDVEEEALEAGVTAFCSKPLFLSDLRDLLEKPFAKETEEAAAPPLVDLSGKRILLAEDNELNMEIAVEILKSVGVEITTAVNGVEAVRIVESNPAGRFDLVLMDVQMPIMDGYEATRCIRRMADKAKACVPIYAMTANTFEEDKQKVLEAGMNGHISKPIEVDQLLKTIEDALTE